MSRLIALAAGVVVVTLLSGCSSTFECRAGGASGSCAAPEITLGSADVAPGSELRFVAGPYSTACDDTGCGVAEPLEDVPVLLAVGDRRLELGTLDADRQLEVRGRYPLPSDLPPGTATLTVGDPEGTVATSSVTITAP